MDSHAFILHQVNLCRNLWLTNFSLQRGGGGSDDTVSKGLQQLVDEGKILNVHGGAISPLFTSGITFQKKITDVYRRNLLLKRQNCSCMMSCVLTQE